MRWPTPKISLPLLVLSFPFLPLCSQAADSQTAWSSGPLTAEKFALPGLEPLAGANNGSLKTDIAHREEFQERRM